MATISLDGAKLHYQSVGRGAALLIIGGAAAGVLEFRRMARRLTRDFQVISYDRRGTLESTGRTDRPLDFAQESRDIRTLLDTLGVRQAIVFGTCGGASAGFDFITRYPGYVKAYIAHEPICIGILPDAVEQRQFVADLRELHEQHGALAAYKAWTDSIGLDLTPIFGRRELARARRDGDFVIRWHIAPMLDFMPDLTAIRKAGIPVVIGAGEGSISGGYFYVHVARAMAEALGSSLVTFPGHHHAYEDRPDAFARSLVEIIGKF
jgi:pimeloyl-ACP methyl ester carboxylesterase